MSSHDHAFLFAPHNSRQPATTRKIHLRRLHDILQLSIQTRQFKRAKRAWAILCRCKETDWKALWTTGLLILGEGEPGNNGTCNAVDYLRAMMLHCPDDRESILQELVFRLLLLGKCREALDELELYLPSFPYQDNPVFHVYAGLCCIFLAQPQQDHSNRFDRNLLRDAQTHLEHAKTLDLDNTVVQAFLEKLSSFQQGKQIPPDDSDDEMELAESHHSKKRARA
ncbi:unnamed protein product [Cyclocybe aegerita]|uniref:Uncharacterized protein n=1 Tax=Cyclocybe aegerita TaxID=1973307 RepID=A0A8S0W2F3_CYCAE|nr:unnamed protein product [Cyclocybe aegerita]